jgi:hypothetical protein
MAEESKLTLNLEALKETWLLYRDEHAEQIILSTKNGINTTSPARLERPPHAEAYLKTEKASRNLNRNASWLLSYVMTIDFSAFDLISSSQSEVENAIQQNPAKCSAHRPTSLRNSCSEQQT